MTNVNFGTVASAYANSSLAPCRIIPPHSWTTPGRNPGTSSKVTNGMLNASHVLMNLAALIEASISKHPARTFGWLATIPTVLPSNLAYPMMMFSAYELNNSMKKPSSTISSITLTMSYGRFGLSGTKVARSGVKRAGSSAVGSNGGLAILWSGKKPIMSIAREHASSSSSAIRHAIPERLA